MAARGEQAETPPARGALGALLVAGAVAVAPHALEQPPWVIGAFAFAAAWRYAADAHGLYRPKRLVRYALVALLVFATWKQFHTLLGRDAGLALLIGLLGLKLLELGTLRDAMLSAFLFYLVTLGSFLYEQTLALGAYALAAVTLSTAALIRLNQPRAPAPRQALALAAALLVKAVPLMLVMYVLFPRLPGGLWAMPAPPTAAQTGLGDSMRPGSINQVALSGETAFRASFEGAPPALRDLYWRALVLWSTDGREWRRGTVRAADAPLTPLAAAVRYEIVLEPSGQPWLPVLDLPAERPAQALARTGHVFELPEPPRDRLRYALASYPRSRGGGLAAGERAAALALPPNLGTRVRALAADWSVAHADARAMSQAALDLFRRENFVYTLEPPLLGADPVDEFLFTTRRGFCEHYAAAYVTLMRAAGVPARVVIGYLGGEYNAAGNYMIVRQSDAHAWAEIWLPDEGWVRVDPTAAVAPERVELGMDAVRRLAAQGTAPGTLPVAEALRSLEVGWLESAWRYSRLYWDLTNLYWYRWVADYGPERQQRLLAALGFERVSLRALLLAMLAGALALLAAYAAWLWRQRPRLDPVQAAYAKFCRKLARLGLVRAAHEGASDFAARCARRQPQLRAEVEAISARYQALRYGRGATRAELGALRRAVARFRPRRRARPGSAGRGA